MSATDGAYQNAVFWTSYGLLVFNERFELQLCNISEEHKEAALQEWFAHLRERLATPIAKLCPDCGTIARVCLGCGRTDC
jgi:hypothetical protein